MTTKEALKSESRLSNAAILAGEGTSYSSNVYRSLVTLYGHDTLCANYGIDSDTHWAEVVMLAVRWGDVDRETGKLT